MIKYLWSGVLLLVFGLLTGSQVLGQVTTATISGIVSDSTGAVIPGATVTARSLETGIERTTITSSEGRFTILQIGLGSYQVRAEAAGFQTVVRTGITLAVGQEALVDFTLQVGAVAETLTVTGEAPVVETTSSAVSVLVEGTTIRDIPLNGRSFDQLVLLQPGVFLARPHAIGGDQSIPGFAQSTMWFSTAGSRPTQSITLLDGTSINSFFYRAGSGVGGRNLGVDSIREFRLLTNNYSAEYGRTNGGVINVATRSGTNTIHGSAFEFMRNSALDAKNFFDLAEEPIPPFRRNQFGASIGGPIVPDRTFFFGVYEGLRDRFGVTSVGFIPTKEARQGILPGRTVTVSPTIQPFLDLFPAEPNGPVLGGGIQQHVSTATQPTTQNFWQVRIDHQISPTHSLFARYTQDRADMTAPFNSAKIEGFPKSATSGSYFSTLQWTAVISPQTLNTARVGYTRTGHVGISAEEPEFFRFVPSYKRIGYLSVGGLSPLGTGSWANNSNTLRNSFQYSDDVTMNRGSHTLKFGGLLERFRDYFFYEYQVTGFHVFTHMDPFLQARPLLFLGSTPGADPSAYWRQWLAAFYVQDDWRVNSRLTLNLGLRYEFQTNATNANKRNDGQFGVAADPVNDTDWSLVKRPFRNNPTLRNISPRFGFAWDVSGNGKTAVRGGFGISYEPMLAHIFTFWVDAPPQLHNVRKFFPSFPQPFVDGIPTNQVFGIDEPSDYNTTASPSVMQFNLNIQRQLPGEMALQIGYVGSMGRHLGLGRDANYAPTTQLPDGRWAIQEGSFRTRRNPHFDQLGLRFFEANSNYQSLQMSLNKRLRRGFMMTLNYTWSKSIDDFSSVRIGESGGNRKQDIQITDCRICERGVSDFDRRHVFNATYSYELPIGRNLTGVAGKLLGGWDISGIVTLNSGLPTSATLFFDRAAGLWAGTINAVRPDLKPGRSKNPVLGDPAQWFDPSAFELQPEGYFGNAGRNTIIGPGLTNFDFSLVKNTPWGESKNLQFRAEFFNIFNHPNFFEPDPNIFTSATSGINPTAGRVSSTASTSRQIQFGLKFTF